MDIGVVARVKSAYGVYYALWFLSGRRIVEVYEFYLKDTSEATIAAGAHPNTKKVVGDMTKVVNTGKGCTCSGLAR